MMLVPSGQPASSTAPGTPPSRWSFAPLSAPQEGRRQLARRDAAAVVADAKIGHAAVFHLHRHALRAGVNGVFQQLLDNARGALDHLARGDEVGDMRR